MPIDPFTRRTTLKLSGALAATGLAGVTSARRADRRDVNELRLFSEMETNEGRGARDVIPYGNYGLIADSEGMTVVGWRNPGRLRTVAEVNGRGPDINDVKVGGDLAGLASDGGNEVTFFDMSDPENPEELGFYDAGSGIHNHYIDGEHAYLTVNESTLIDTDGDGDPDEIIVFGETRMEVVDVSDPTDPTKAGEWRLKNHFPAFANAWINPCHDIVVEDDLAYVAWWDAGTFIFDVSDPSEPELVSHFDESDYADVEVGAVPLEDSGAAFPLERYLTLTENRLGNAHLSKPSHDGDYVFVNAETYPRLLMDDPDTEDYGGIRIYDVTDFDDPELVARIDPPEEPNVMRTSHNFTVTANRLDSAWYGGGVRVHDITDPETPEEIANYQPEGVTFDTAARTRSFTTATVRGEGLVLLHDDRGKKRPPAFDGSMPSSPDIDRSIDEA